MSGGSFTVREPRPEELAEVRALMVRVIARDYGYGYHTQWHADLDDPQGFYLDNPRQALFVAVDDATGRIVGTAGVRTLAITSPPHPPAILARYDRERSAELTRVFVAPETRRRGIGQALVERARHWVAGAGDYDIICFHSRTAVDFWRALPTTEVLDARRAGEEGPSAGSVYFDMVVPERAGGEAPPGEQWLRKEQRAMGVGMDIDWQAWTERWDRQQESYLPGREERFRLMLDYVARQRGDGSLRIIDLCCGPGSISARVLRRFPEATVLAVDLDPWLVELGRRTVGTDEPRRVEWREADLRADDWAGDLAPGSFDAVLSATALHWFQPEALVRLYRHLAELLAEGGIFLNFDPLPSSAARLDKLSRGLLADWRAANHARPGVEDWERYWAAARAEPAFAGLLAERERRFANRPPGRELPVGFHREALLAAGFREVGEVWRQHEDAILVALH